MRKLSHNGFTLLEILIATLIFAWIATETTRAIRNSQTHKAKIDEDIDTYQAIRSAFQIFRKDISNVYHLNTIDFLPYGHLLPEDRPDTPVNLKDPATYKSYIEQNFPMLTHKSTFIGEAREMHFTSLSHFRLYSDKHESEQAEISFIVEADAKRKEILHLFKRESPVIDDKPTEGGRTYLILEDLADVKFRYFDADKEEWAERWDSHQDPHIDEIPDVIEVKLVVNSRNPMDEEDIKKIEIVTSFHPLFRNTYARAGIGGLDSLEKLMQPPSAAAPPGSPPGTPPPADPNAPQGGSNP